MARKVGLNSAQYPYPSSPAASAVMKRNVKSDTKPEVAVRSLLHRRGYRFRKHLLVQAGDIRVRPDIVFTRRRIAIFIDGCFWHRCPLHGTEPRSNSEYWRQKLDRNVARDVEVDSALKAANWLVLRIWEHVPPVEAVEQIDAVLQSRPS